MIRILYSSLVLRVVRIFKEFKTEGFGAIFRMQNELHESSKILRILQLLNILHKNYIYIFENY